MEVSEKTWLIDLFRVADNFGHTKPVFVSRTAVAGPAGESTSISAACAVAVNRSKTKASARKVLIFFLQPFGRHPSGRPSVCATRVEVLLR